MNLFFINCHCEGVVIKRLSQTGTHTHTHTYTNTHTLSQRLSFPSTVPLWNVPLCSWTKVIMSLFCWYLGRMRSISLWAKNQCVVCSFVTRSEAQGAAGWVWCKSKDFWFTRVDVAQTLSALAISDPQSLNNGVIIEPREALIDRLKDELGKGVLCVFVSTE